MHHRRKMPRKRTRYNHSHGHWKNPKWWDIVFNTIPKRRQNTRLAADVVAGRKDPDDIPWPVNAAKVTPYYW